MGAELDTLKGEVCRARLAGLNNEWQDILRNKGRAKSEREFNFWEGEQERIEKVERAGHLVSSPPCILLQPAGILFCL